MEQLPEPGPPQDRDHEVDVPVLHTQAELQAALVDRATILIALVPEEGLHIDRVPANPAAAILVDGNPGYRFWVDVLVTVAVTVEGHGRVDAFGAVRITASGQAHVIAHDAVQVTASGQARVSANDAVQVSASGQVTVTAFGNSDITATDQARVTAYNVGTVTVSDQAQVIAHEARQVIGHGSGVRILAQEGVPVTAEEGTVRRISAEPWPDWEDFDQVWAQAPA